MAAAWVGLTWTAVAVAALLSASGPAFAADPPPAAGAAASGPARAAAPVASAMDAPLFYQLLIGEMELRAGRAGSAFEVILDAARRQGDDTLFERAVDIALQARAGEQALAAVQAWQQRRPGSLQAAQYETQILLALNRGPEAREAMARWIDRTPAAERPGLISAVPRLFGRLQDRKAAMALVEKLLAPYREVQATRVSALVATARARAAAGQEGEALGQALVAQQADPESLEPALLAADLMASQPAAEELVRQRLARPGDRAALRMAYVRQLTQRQRYQEARTQLQQVVADKPDEAEPWLMLGALQVELREPAAAETALLKYVQLAESAAKAAGPGAGSDDARSDDAAENAAVVEAHAEQRAAAASAGLEQAWLLLAQAAEQRKDLAAADRWLARIDSPQRLIEVATRRAILMARQGQVEQARRLLQGIPERTGEDARSKLMAEVQVLREVQQWQKAAEVLESGLARSPDDIDLLYELAMIDDKLKRYAEMERRLKRVIELKPEHSHAHNALGYSLADRNIRLAEARELIQRALTLSPGDPFITDSLGWVHYREGRRADAIRVLRQAYDARPDPEIGAHLGEVLWVDGQKDAALKVWREALARDAGNAVLLETLQRLKAQP